VPLAVWGLHSTHYCSSAQWPRGRGARPAPALQCSYGCGCLRCVRDVWGAGGVECLAAAPHSPPQQQIFYRILLMIRDGTAQQSVPVHSAQCDGQYEYNCRSTAFGRKSVPLYQRPAVGPIAITAVAVQLGHGCPVQLYSNPYRRDPYNCRSSYR
jgi:hypothetical protein